MNPFQLREAFEVKALTLGTLDIEENGYFVVTRSRQTGKYGFYDSKSNKYIKEIYDWYTASPYFFLGRIDMGAGNYNTVELYVAGVGKVLEHEKHMDAFLMNGHKVISVQLHSTNETFLVNDMGKTRKIKNMEPLTSMFKITDEFYLRVGTKEIYDNNLKRVIGPKASQLLQVVYSLAQP